ncbi:DNA-binding protein [Moritella sp. F3]|uniref:DNA-binding protein n=1 Tax=Moritella sp. F3 TaxID=2718882 RepID=UPI0018E12AAB|nr:DNA-binding protein [Moritella sp. F3]GIC77723.1 hypothetical protein FMO001_24500 [Moritella sp. F1]GIC82136.1 hypothetical protein FMO003_24170 [Moritella sp. F3]
MEKKQAVPLTFNDVKEVCDRLHSMNEKVSGNRIIAELGRGSKGTALNFIKQWREELDASLQHLRDSMGFSEAFSISFMQEIGRYKSEIALQFEETLTAAKLLEAEALIALTEAEQKLEIAYSDLGKKDEAITAFKQEIATITSSSKTSDGALRSQIIDLEKSISEHVGKADRLTTELAKAEVRLGDNFTFVTEAKLTLEKKQGDIDTLSNELSKSNEIIATLTAQDKAANDALQLLQTQSKTSILSLENRLSQGEAQSIALADITRSERKDLQGEVSKLNTQFASESASHQALIISYGETGKLLDLERAAHDVTRGELSILQKLNANNK